MKIINGTSVYDFTQGVKGCKTELYTTLHDIPDLALLMDGSTTTTATQDAVHKIGATMAGGVGGAWTHASNYRTNVLAGAVAPVIAEATDNLDANADCAFTPFGDTTWAALNGSALAASTDGEYGSSSMEITCGANVAGGARLATVPVAAQPYTCSCRVKANNAGAVGKNLRIDYDGTQANVTLTANWQTLKVTDAAASGVAINADVYFTAGDNGDKVLVSAWQRENKAYQTPWAYDSRTASTMTFPTASLGLVAGQDMSIVIVTKTPWAGNDGVRHDLFYGMRIAPSVDGFLLAKAAANTLVIISYIAGVTRSMSLALTAVNWSTDTTHIIIATLSAANAQQIFLNGTAGAVSAGAGARETVLPANAYIGSDLTGASQANAPILVAIYNRVLSANEISLLSRMGAWCQRMKGF